MTLLDTYREGMGVDFLKPVLHETGIRAEDAESWASEPVLTDELGLLMPPQREHWKLEVHR